MTHDLRLRGTNMDRETDIFDLDTGSGDSDTDLAHAAQVLQKIAGDENIDLNSLSDEQVSDLLADLMPKYASDGDETEDEADDDDADDEADDDTDTKESSAMNTDDELTYADVAVELSKVAAAEGIDLAQVGRDEYTAAFSQLAERMADPEYNQAKVAEAEKLAEAYTQGARMAEGFLDRLKLAEGPDEEGEDEAEEAEEAEIKESSAGTEMVRRTRMSAAGARVRQAVQATQGAGRSAAEAVGRGAKAVGRGAKAVDSKAQMGGEKLLNMIGKGEKASPALKRTAAALAAGTVGAGVAGAGVAAGAIGHHSAKKKYALDEMALKVAQEMAIEMGYDPSTGEKTAGITEDEVAARALDMLAEAGYLG